MRVGCLNRFVTSWKYIKSRTTLFIALLQTGKLRYLIGLLWVQFAVLLIGHWTTGMNTWGKGLHINKVIGHAVGIGPIFQLKIRGIGGENIYKKYMIRSIKFVCQLT